MKINKFSPEAQHKIALTLLKDILLTYQKENLSSNLKQIEEFSRAIKIQNPIYANGNLYKGVYTLIEEKVYSSVVVTNPISVFDYLGIKWSPEKTMIFQACGDYLTFYNEHHKYQDILKRNAYLKNLLEERAKKQEQSLSQTATRNSIYLQGIILETPQSFYNDPLFLTFCNYLIKENAPLLFEPEFFNVILSILQTNSETLNQNNANESSNFQRSNTKMLHKILTFSPHS